MTKYIIGLTGGIGSGKSTVSNIFATLGVPLVDSDIIARQIVKPGSATMHAIIQYFGPSIQNLDGSINRAALRKRVFISSKEKNWLNNLLHPLIQQQTEQLFCCLQAPYVLWVVPLLIENNLQKYTNRILVVDVDPNIQIIRTIKRDNINYKQVENILAAQVLRQHRLTYANDIIDNSGYPEKITNHIAALHQHYLTLAKLKS